jgi:hypothetical protein
MKRFATAAMLFGTTAIAHAQLATEEIEKWWDDLSAKFAADQAVNVTHNCNDGECETQSAKTFQSGNRAVLTTTKNDLTGEYVRTYCYSNATNDHSDCIYIESQGGKAFKYHLARRGETDQWDRVPPDQ